MPGELGIPDETALVRTKVLSFSIAATLCRAVVAEAGPMIGSYPNSSAPDGDKTVYYSVQPTVAAFESDNHAFTNVATSEADNAP